MQRKTGLRTAALLAVAAALVSMVTNGVASSSASSVARPAKTSLTIGLSVANIQTVDAEVAVDEGFFTKQHLAVTFVNLQPSASIAALEDGSIQIGEADPATLLRAYDLGENFKMLNGGTRTDLVIVALDSIKCPTWHSAFPGPLACLVGHLVGTPTLNDNNQVLGEYLLNQAPGCLGAGSRCVNWIADTNPLLWVPYLQNGSIQAQVAWASTLPIYTAKHLAYWTVADAELSPSERGNAGKLVPLNVTAVPVASASELNNQPKAYEGFCQAMADANAWLDNPRNLNKAGAIAQSWLGDGTSLSTAIAQVKAQNESNLAHVTPAEWRGSERIYPALAAQPYKNVDWPTCDRIRAPSGS